MDDLERKIRDRQIKILEEEIEEVHHQWESATSDEQRLMLQRRVDQKFELLRKLKGNGNNERQKERNISVPSQNPTLQNTDTDSVKAFERGYAQEQKGEYRLALIDYTEVIRLKPNYILAYARRGLTFQKLNDQSVAKQDFLAATSLPVQIAEDYLGRGIARANLGDKQGAINDYNASIRLKPDDANAYFHRGDTKQSQAFFNVLKKQSQALKNAMDMKMKDTIESVIESLTFRSSLLRFFNMPDLKEIEKEEKQRLKVIEEEEKQRLEYNKAIIDEYNKALPDYNEAIRLKPNFADPYYNRGLIKKQRGEKQEALADFRKASELYQQQGNTEWYNNSRDRIRELGGG